VREFFAINADRPAAPYQPSSGRSFTTVIPMSSAHAEG
jgi:hypothetical protein